jgi:hypothetical protein
MPLSAELPGTPKQRAEAMQVGHALVMVAVLPRYVHADPLPAAVNVACLDALFIYARLLIEFLVRKPDTQQRDIHRYDFLPNWDPPETPLVTQLTADWVLASKQVAHLSRARVVSHDDPGYIRVDDEALWALVRRVLDQTRVFCQELAARDNEWASQFALYLEDAARRIP